jgi:3-oxoacyl-[acyl-carrier protein] reductase
MFAEIKERAGRLDVLVNSAGIIHESLLSFTTAAKFLEILQVNLIGSFLCMQAAVRLMLPQRSGCIVNVSSAAALRAPVGLGAYAASKAALNAMTSSFAREVAPKGIRINTVAPAWVDTDMLTGSRDRKAAGQRRVAIDRLATADDVAGAVASIVGDDFKYLIGQVIVLDGGGLV